MYQRMFSVDDLFIHVLVRLRVFISFYGIHKYLMAVFLFRNSKIFYSNVVCFVYNSEIGCVSTNVNLA